MIVYVLMYWSWWGYENYEMRLFGAFSDLAMAKQNATDANDPDEWSLVDGKWMYVFQSPASSGRGFYIAECPIDTMINIEI